MPVVIIVAALLVVGVLAFDWVRTGRVKKALAGGGKAPNRHTGARASEGVSSESLARQNGNSAGQASGYGSIT